jgi:hypothetical protein
MKPEKTRRQQNFRTTEPGTVYRKFMAKLCRIGRDLMKPRDHHQTCEASVDRSGG